MGEIKVVVSNREDGSVAVVEGSNSDDNVKDDNCIISNANGSKNGQYVRNRAYSAGGYHHKIQRRNSL